MHNWPISGQHISLYQKHWMTYVRMRQTSLTVSVKDAPFVSRNALVALRRLPQTVSSSDEAPFVRRGLGSARCQARQTSEVFTASLISASPGADHLRACLFSPREVTQWWIKQFRKDPFYNDTPIPFGNFPTRVGKLRRDPRMNLRFLLPFPESFCFSKTIRFRCVWDYIALPLHLSSQCMKGACVSAPNLKVPYIPLCWHSMKIKNIFWNIFTAV